MYERVSIPMPHSLKPLFAICALGLVLVAVACAGEETTEPAPAALADAPAVVSPPSKTVPAPAAESAATLPVVEAEEPAAEVQEEAPEPAPIAVVDQIIGPTTGNELEAPDLTQISGWINTEPFSLEEHRGSVVLIDFWTYTCINCIRTLPYLKDWHAKYADEGLGIVGVHTPEFEFEKKYSNVSDAVAKFDIKYAVVQDNEFGTWRAYNNRFWPAKYLIDKDGFIRYTHFGEGAYVETEKAIRELLAESGSAVTRIEPSLFPEQIRDPNSLTGDAMTSLTRELYGGFERNYGALVEGSTPPYVRQTEYYEKPETTVVYEDPGDHVNHFIYLQGAWNNALESLDHGRVTEAYEDYIAVHFFGTEVNAVIKPKERESYEVRVLIDEMPVPMSLAGSDVMFDEIGNSFVLVNEPKLYNIVRSDSFSDHELRLSSNSRDFSLFAFTFGSYVE